ncbi:hypothetical protein [Legionella donaldsonii]|uniref:hypothetical protein n=1 Tax=Legionella donaldsonii TaxID=45060 RepID=UPI00399D1A7F
MPFSARKLAKQAVQALIQPTIKNLKDVKEVNDQIINDTLFTMEEGLDDLLQRGAIPKTEYKLQMGQSQVELNNRLRAKEQLNGTLDRFNQFADEKNEISSFVIAENTTREELKELISILKTKGVTAEDPNEKRFLETILQTAESYKTMIDAGRPISEKEIPILESEQRYANQIFASLQTNKVKPDVLNKYLDQLEEIKSYKEKTNNDPKLSTAEKQVVNSLCDSLSMEIKTTLAALTAPSATGPGVAVITPEEIIKNHKAKIAGHLTSARELETKVPVTSGFKGLINDICRALDCKPVFTAAGTVQNMKSQLNAIKGHEEVEPQRGLKME